MIDVNICSKLGLINSSLITEKVQILAVFCSVISGNIIKLSILELLILKSVGK